MTTTALFGLAALASLLGSSEGGAADAKQPVQVFVLAGQSNMEGKAKVALLERQLSRPATSDLFRHLRVGGKWVERDDVWIKFLDREGRLTVGYGSPGCIGPELEFGNVVGDRCDAPVLLIKAAWGGRSLWRDFRPPSAGYPAPEALEKMLADAKKKKPETTIDDIKKGFGASYRAMLEEVNRTLADLEKHVPGSAGHGYEMAGFIWFHGWNDMIDAVAMAEYAANLAHFIRDVRRDLGAPRLPFVIGQMGVGGPSPDPNIKRFKDAQAAVMETAEFKGNVALVKTDALWDMEAEAVFKKGWREHIDEWNEVGSDWPYHYLGSAKTMVLIGRAFGEAVLELRGEAASATQAPPPPRLASDGLWGYVGMDVPAPPEEFGYGVGLYSTAWPLVERPLRDFQIGLASIWIVPENRKIEEPLLPTGTVARDNWPERGPSYRDVFQTIEGGLGFWASTRFGSTTAKFRMNGTANGYNHEISSPGWGFGSIEALGPEEMGIAQLSPRLLVPPDGLTFREGTCGDLFGYAWMVLPLVEAKRTTAGLPVSTGNQCWTLFLNSANFKGPVAFYTPVTWSRISRRHPPAVGRGLDARPGLVTGGAIEINTVPRFVGKDRSGVDFTRIPRLQFPADDRGRTILIHNLTHYSKDALYRRVESWLAGGEAPSGRFDEKGALVPPCKARRLDIRQGPEKIRIRGCEDWVETAAFDGTTFGLQWKPSALEPWSGGMRRGTFPEYCRLDGKELAAVAAGLVPAETGLKEAIFAPAKSDSSYTSPETPDGPWKAPGPKAGPFQAKLSDGSIVTYWWYRFIDQPSLRDADLSGAEKDRLQAAVEKIHRHWTMDREYMPPPGIGKLAALDGALIVLPRKGLEVGHVPIATRQSP